MKLQSGFLLLCVIHLCLLLSAANIVFNDNMSTGHLLTFINIILITSWCTLDAKNRKFALPHAYKFFIFFFTPIGWPAYILSSRGFFEGMKFIGLQLLIYVCVTLLPTSVVGIIFHRNIIMAQ